MNYLFMKYAGVVNEIWKKNYEIIQVSYDVVITKNGTWILLWEYLIFTSVDLYMIRCSGYALFKITHVAWSVETDVLHSILCHYMLRYW